MQIFIIFLKVIFLGISISSAIHLGLDLLYKYSPLKCLFYIFGCSLSTTIILFIYF